MKVLTNIDLAKNEIQNAKIQNLATPPSNPAPGQIYYDAGEKTFKGWNTVEWKDLGQVLAGKDIVSFINGCSSVINNANLSQDVNDAIANKHLHDNKSILDATTSSFTTTLKSKLDGIDSNANKYTHPESHPATMIVDDATHRFVTDTEKTNWDDKYSKTEIDNKISAVITNLDWKESVDTFANIDITYPNPQDGWTVNVKDTDLTYRYSGTEWITISANAIPLVSDSVDGKMSASDKVKLNGVTSGATKVESSTNNGNIKINGAEKTVYTHPENHSADIIVDGTTNKAFTATEKTKLSNIESGAQVNKVTSVAGKTGAVTLVKADVGLKNVTNESKATMFTDPVFTGIPTAPTATNATNNTQIATTAFVKTAVGAVTKSTLGLSNVENKSSATIRGEITSSNVTNALEYTPTKKYTASIGNGTATEYTVIHNLGTKDLNINLEEVATGEVVFTDVQKVDTNNIKLLFAQAPTTNQYRVTVVG